MATWSCLCSVVLRHGGGGASAQAQHCTATTNWLNTIQCLGSDDIMSLGIKSSATKGWSRGWQNRRTLPVHTEPPNHCRRFGSLRRLEHATNVKFTLLPSFRMEFRMKGVQMARYELILKLDGALWLRIISKPPLTPKKAMEGQTNQKESKMPPGTGGNPCTRTNETWPYPNTVDFIFKSIR